jgi:plasmid stabilization system protein ParE
VRARLSARAERELSRLDARWRAERPAAPDLLTDELLTAVRALQSSPEIGVAFGTLKNNVVRRILLEKSEYHVYYIVLDDEVFVLSIWGARRGRTPRFGGASH